MLNGVARDCCVILAADVEALGALVDERVAFDYGALFARQRHVGCAAHGSAYVAALEQTPLNGQIVVVAVGHIFGVGADEVDVVAVRRCGGCVDIAVADGVVAALPLHEHHIVELNIFGGKGEVFHRGVVDAVEGEHAILVAIVARRVV